MNTPNPSKPRPIYSGKVEYPKLFIDGKEYPLPTSIQNCGVVDFEKGTVTYYERKMIIGRIKNDE